MKNIRLTDKYLWLCIGMVSNISAFKIWGNTIFIYLLYGLVFLFLSKEKKIKIYYTPYIIYVGAAVISTFLCLISPELVLDWKIKCMTAFANTSIILLIYYIMTGVQKRVEYFLKGIRICCILQVVWGWGQLILDKAFGLELNLMLGFSDQYKSGKMVYNALTAHAGLLVPTLIIGFLTEKNLFAKLLFLGFAFLTRNTTVMIAMFCCVLLYGIMISIPQYLFHLSKDKAKRALLLAVIVVICLTIMLDNVRDDFVYNFSRVISLMNGRMTSGSDATHLRYLTSFPKIIANSSIVNILFGFGLGTSGFQMVKYFNQYSTSIWTVECDWIDIFYSVGVIGFAIIYGVLIYISILGYKINKKYTIYGLSMMIAGAFYNFHLYWVLIFEIILFDFVRKKRDIWKVIC